MKGISHGLRSHFFWALCAALTAHGLLGYFLISTTKEPSSIERLITFSGGAPKHKTKSQSQTANPNKDSMRGDGQGGQSKGRFKSDTLVQQLTNQIENRVSYPMMARRLCQQGRTRLRVSVEPEGDVSKVEIFESSGFRILDQAAIKAVRGFRFARGEKRETFLLRPIRFVLEGC